jgi:hypothetical protein
MPPDHPLIIPKIDGSVEAPNGEVIYFSCERFRSDICEGACCFLCGRSHQVTGFNEEHVLPKWLLADFDLFDKYINLPNGARFRYGEYTIPCCKNCNSRLGEEIETPISELFRGGFEAVANHIQSKGTWLFYTWLSLVFLKTHLRDHLFRFHLDRRLGNERLSKEYDWSEFHHAHAVARAFVSGCKVTPEALGSFRVFPMAASNHYEHFDYHDLFLAQSALVRIHDVGIIAVFDDGYAALSNRQRFFSKIDGALSPVQLREVLAHLAFTNLNLAKRPTFFADFQSVPVTIRASRAQYVEMAEHEPETLGRIMHACVGHYLDSMLNPDIDQIRAAVKSGNYTFLYDNNGAFIKNSMEPLAP